MTTGPTLIASLLAERQEVHGMFVPQAYAIGLTADYDQTAASLPRYPLDRDNPEEMKAFRNALTLYHEATHFAQYVSTSFGLQMARMNNICSTRLNQHGPWTLPILATPFEEMDGEDLDRFVAFKFLFESLRPTSQVTDRPLGMKTIPVPSLVACPTSPSLYLLNPDTPISEAVAFLKGSNSQTHAEYHVITPERSGKHNDVLLNVAALMEGYAQIAELHHIGNATGDMGASLIELLDQALPIYTAVIAVYLLIYQLPLNYIILQLSALIDIALMYSPHLIFNIGPAHGISVGGDRYLTPPEIFVAACEAAQKVRPISDHASSEVQRFQDEVCDAMKIPGTKEMTDIALQRLAQIGIKSKEDCNAILEDERPMHTGKLFTLHWLGLNYRKQHGDGYCADMFKTSYLIDMINVAAKHVTLYDLRTGIPFEFDSKRIITSSLSTLIWDALHNAELECPLKMGRPYFCEGANNRPGSLCVFLKTNEGKLETQSGLLYQGECILDLFEQSARIRTNSK